MKIAYEIVPDDQVECCRELCHELMAYQKSVATIKPELFDAMNFDTRTIPSIQRARHNYTIVAKDVGKVIGYAYSNISPKEVYDNAFATFFDLVSVQKDNVGCLSQFYLKEEYRQTGIGSTLFRMSMDWLLQFDEVKDYFIYVSNGNDRALHFYQRKGFAVSHQILDGFITVLRYKETGKGE